MRRNTMRLRMPDISVLSISPEQVSFIADKARQFDAKDVLTDPDDASNAADDGMRAVLEDHPDDPVRRELVSFINALNEDEQIDLVALWWLGRGDEDISEWSALRRRAAEAHNQHTARYLL